MVDKTPPEEMYEFILNKSIPNQLEYIKKGDISAKYSLHTRYRTLAVLEWYLHQNADKYRKYLKISLHYECDWFNEAKKKIPDNWFYCPFGEAITSLCTGDFSYAQEYITFLDDYNCPNYKHYMPWMYYVLITLTLGRYENEFTYNMDKLKKQYATKKYSLLMPQIPLLESLLGENEKKFHESLDIVANTYKPNGIFYDWYEDRFIYMKALALCNLALGRGMKVDFDHPFVPRALIGPG